MNRQNYLDQASLARFDGQLIQLARTVVTADDVKDATVRLEGDIGKHRKITQLASFVLRGGIMLAVAAMLSLALLNVFFGQFVHPALMAGLSFLSVLGLAVFLDCTVVAQEDRISMLRALQPIAGSEACEEALELVQAGHAEVRAWRDVAIAERGQLHRFDVSVMRCLDYQRSEAETARKIAEDQAAREEERKRRIAEACRIVHGI